MKSDDPAIRWVEEPQLGLSGKLYLPMFVQGLTTTFKHLKRSLSGDVVTVSYPDQEPQIGRSLRTRVRPRQRPRAHGPPQGPRPLQQPPHGSNWELLCLYCHVEEHAKYVSPPGSTRDRQIQPLTHKPFAALAGLLKDEES